MYKVKVDISTILTCWLIYETIIKWTRFNCITKMLSSTRRAFQTVKSKTGDMKFSWSVYPESHKWSNKSLYVIHNCLTDISQSLISKRIISSQVSCVNQLYLFALLHSIHMFPLRLSFQLSTFVRDPSLDWYFKYSTDKLY